GAASAELELLGPDVGIVDHTEGQERLVPEGAQLLREPATVLVADVDRGRRPLALDEEPALRRVVALQGAVEVQVLLAEVGEREGGEADAFEPAQLGAVRGRFERTASVAGVEHLAEGALQIDRLGCRPDRWTSLAADAAFDRAEQPRTPPGRGQDRMEKEGGRRLPVRPRDAGNLELPRRFAEEDDGRLGHRPPGVRDDDLRDVELERPLDDERGRPPLHSVTRERVTVVALAGHAEEERPGPDGARVVGEVGDLDRSAVDDVR